MAVRVQNRVGGTPPPSSLLEPAASDLRPHTGSGRPENGPAYGVNSSAVGLFANLGECFIKQYGFLVWGLEDHLAVEAFMLKLKDSAALVEQTHAFIIQRCDNDRNQGREMSRDAASPEWERVVKAVTRSVRASLLAS